MKDFLPFTRPTLDEATIAAVAAVLRSGQLASGPRVLEFESALADYLGGARTVRALTSATEGLEIALLACGVGPGDEVIVPAMSFAASANVIVRAGATPVFVDVDLASRNLDVGQVERAITPRTKAIMPVHFSGLAVDMDALLAIAERHRLRVVEDAAHAIGTRHRGRPIGSFGDVAVFSFHPNKNMTSIEGGAIATTDAALVERIERHRFHGIRRNADGEIDVEFAGAKSNLSDVAAAVGLGQLRRLDEFNARRRLLAARYFERLADFDRVMLPARGDEGHSWHMVTVLIDFVARGISRPQFQRAMAARGIGIGVHYPCIPGMTFYRQHGFRAEDYPNAARIGRETVTLPLFPAMRDEDVDRVVAALQAELD
ncbi:MAG: DegT/DnrJ/EryC1/StrS family aminotransferase [Gammaproteobacteria bacterium]|nr:DegT/DnrJ/EryC1/StrS family aminotransferase [Gammaproteobacteria bacterium]